MVKAEHVDSYLLYLKNKYKNNTIRLEMCACSSFYSSLRRYGYITTNPFYGSPLPRKEFKKAIQTDQKKTIPVMNQEEFDIIMKTLRQMSRMKGKKAQIKNSRRSARRLIPVIHFLGTYGLRVGSLLSVEVKDGYFTFTGKGNKSQRVELEDDIVKGTKPFKNYKVITIQKAISRVTGKLFKERLIRHWYSCHDFRHYFACQYYNRTKDIIKLKQKLSHASVNVTDIYLQSVGVG